VALDELAHLVGSARWASKNWPERYRNFAEGFRLPRPANEFHSKNPNQRATLSLREVGKILIFLASTKTRRRLVPGIALQGLCGLRVREVFRLRWDKIDLEEGTLSIEGEVKNPHSVRTLPLPKLVVEILKTSKRSGPFVIADYANDQQYAEAVRQAIRKWQPNLNLEPKGFRRSLPSVGKREGWHDYALERYIGHSPKTITERYYYIPTEEERIDLLRTEVAERVDAKVSLFLKVWQRNGKSKDRKSLEKNGVRQ